MKIGIIQASSQNDKNALLFETVRKYAGDAEVINFGCNGSENESYSYIEISVMIGLLLASGSVDFIVTGCSSGQGMMLACNSMPGVLCGYIPSPEDAYLFAQINNGNAVSLPLGEEYSWRGYDNFDLTLKNLFSEPFGQGYPKSEAERKLKDTRLLKDIRKKSQIGFNELFESLDDDMIRKVLTKKDVIRFVLENGNNVCLSDLLRGRLISNEK
ncbi:MAG: RpiB/LacA/LacB family sugar-phosphate isomerase [Clostridiales bacterium]|nr:RpiB/LacA/LacB family sugar-phosphate isomerase [Clostridiales bacterium]